MLNSQHDSALEFMKIMENKAIHDLVELRKQMADKQKDAICEILGIKMGDVVRIEFGSTNYEWKVVDSDIQGVNVYLVNPEDCYMRSRTLFHKEAREGKYIITK